jgi:hypothetical protein
MGGPYETERQALADCTGIYDAMRSKCGQMQPLNLAVLEEACTAAGVELGEFDRSVLGWIATFEPHTCQAVAEIIRRAAKL